MNILFLGYGKMGQALGNAWIENNLVSKIVAIDPNITADGVRFFNHQSDVPLQNFDIVILAVKPNLAKEILEELKPQLFKNACIISIMAGVTTETLKSIINNDEIPIIRVMPNTAVLANAGCCVLYTDFNLETNSKDNIEKLFFAVGYAIWIDNEEDLHGVTALSGSGPAYFHLFTEALANAGEKLGLKKEIAESLAKQTALGAALLQIQSKTDLVKLRENVTSPNGTTHAAIQVFEDNFFLRDLTNKALQAALNRSIELSKV
ncbi:pyrroline-5-carboxylate reductase [Acinetobacter gyllenbergii]|uniref:Pyrroline-5-carboxylate reductase n=1 Tax=Acinetobacter gyllenbergii CIP 110306 = MTCC 11365 TaxID=1217657 RepID=A0A829HN60_9GAMM|nr:pyrroline-5-carboxylate reductase [Acinetobacter gyllenbergii]EPF93391.1 pyrroline-5-carboxylate reductase [Acinetobacter gyllenbergii CIP 110306 = MTCC 11365]EPH32415.1 Pyrroline-5-carboxylate reductase [Acinetobacter gyllenbergii CIP 110306 = MTCC 11365]GMA11921.1 pyrroline-5-carboxylate reductase [Acinetobacter gyllenbergii]